MNAALLASSHYLQAVGDGPLPSLEGALGAACRGQHRRVDRFIQLALLGAARCAAGRSLKDCFLYLGSGVGPVGNNIVVQEQLCRERLLPRPFNFVNTLGSSATFFVARELGLDGQGWWAGRRGGSLEALLALALADLELGLCSSALVGVVEECPEPYGDQRRRLGVPADLVLAEGSHWLLLGSPARADADAGSLAAVFDLGPEALVHNVRAALRPGDSLALGPGIPAELGRRLTTAAGSSDPAPLLPFHDSLAAAELTRRLESGRPGRLQLLCGVPDSYVRLEVTPRA